MAMQRRGDLVAELGSLTFSGAPSESFILRCFSSAQDGLSCGLFSNIHCESSVWQTPCSHAQHGDTDRPVPFK